MGGGFELSIFKLKISGGHIDFIVKIQCSLSLSIYRSKILDSRRTYDYLITLMAATLKPN